MPVSVEVKGATATYRQGDWESDDDRLLEYLRLLTKDSISAPDPEGLEGVREAVGVLGGRIVEVTATSELPRDVIY